MWGEMKCNRCGGELHENEGRAHLGETLCDDCYLEAATPVKACDPWAVSTATRSRELSGQSGSEGLTALQQSIYEFIRERGKVTGEEVMVNFSISQRELETQCAILRHCELLKGRKEGDKVYLVPFV